MSHDKSCGGRVGGNHVIHMLSLARMLLGKGAWGGEGREEEEKQEERGGMDG